MSRRESRDHHGKRLHSRFDREPSPKKARRDAKLATERTFSRSRDLDINSPADHDQKQSRRLLDLSQLDIAPAPGKPVQPETGKKDTDKKTDEKLNGTKHSSDEKEVPRARDEKEVPRAQDEKEVPRARDKKEVPRSRTYIQHDERNSAVLENHRSVRKAIDHGRWNDSKGADNGRRSDPKGTDHGRSDPKGTDHGRWSDLKGTDHGRRSDSKGTDHGRWSDLKGTDHGRRSDPKVADHGRWSDSKEQYNDRTRSKGDARELWRKDERTQSVTDDKEVWKHDKFSELEAEAPPPKKRPAFSEKKMPIESESIAAVNVSERIRMPHELALEGARREERRHYRSPGVDKSDRPFAKVDERNGRRGVGPLHRAEIPRPSYQGKEGFRGGFMRGREMADGGYNERNAYRSGVVQADKWKHDLFEEANRSPSPKNEEDQIAKVEALLAL